MAAFQPIRPEQACAIVRRRLEDGSTNRLIIQTNHGNVELPVDEIWLNSETRTLHLSVALLPEAATTLP